MGKNVKKEATKAFKKLGPAFYVEALEELGSLKLYDISKVGHVLIKYAKKNGMNLVASNAYCQAMVNWMESLGLVEKSNGFYVPTKDWEVTLKKRFPNTDVLELKKKPEEVVVTAQSEPVKEEEKKPVTYRDYYHEILEGLGNDFVTLDKIRSLIRETYLKVTGQEPDSSQTRAREKFLRKSFVESIKDDDGSLKFLVVTDWQEKLNKNKRILSVIPVAEKPKEEPEVTKPVDKQPAPKVKKHERPYINIWLDSSDADSLMNFDVNKDILFSDESDGRILARVQLVDPNLDLLMKLHGVVVVKHQLEVIRELYKRRREFHLQEIRTIDSICQFS